MFYFNFYNLIYLQEQKILNIFDSKLKELLMHVLISFDDSIYYHHSSIEVVLDCLKIIYNIDIPKNIFQIKPYNLKTKYDISQYEFYWY